MGPIGSMAGTAVGASMGSEVGGDQTEDPGAPPDLGSTLIGTTGLGNVTGGGATFDEEEEKEKNAIKKKKLGARGLRIPLTSTQSNTTSNVTGGVQI